MKKKGFVTTFVLVSTLQTAILKCCQVSGKQSCIALENACDVL